MAVWSNPDATQQPAGQMPPNLDVVVETMLGAWAQVRVANGWRGWVDGRLLIPYGPR